jgi:hypothetical protein
MNHSVVSMVGPDPAKVRCRTCYNDHDYRHEQAPPPKVDNRKAALFNEVLSKLQPDATGAAPAEAIAPVEDGAPEEAAAPEEADAPAKGKPKTKKR